MTELVSEAERVIVCGLSMGGPVVLYLAAEQPEQIAGVITIAAALCIADRGSAWRRLMPASA